MGQPSIVPPPSLQNMLQSLPDDEAGAEMGLKAFVAAKYPPHGQPYASLRDRYILTLMGEKNFKRAFHHAIVRYFFIDPVHYPTTFHPIRVVRLMALHRLVGAIMPDAKDVGRNVGWGDTDWKQEGWIDNDWPILMLNLMMEYKEGLRLSHGEETGIWQAFIEFEARIRQQLPEGAYEMAKQRKKELWAKLRRIAERWKDVVCYSPEVEEEAKREGRAAALPESEVIVDPPR